MLFHTTIYEKVFILTNDNLNSDTEQLIKNLNLKYQVIKLKSNLIEEISVEYDNDLPMFYIESGYKLEINLNLRPQNLDFNTYYHLTSLYENLRS